MTALRTVVNHLAAKLGRTERLVVMLRYADGLSDREIAGLVDLEPEEVSWTLTQAKDLFRAGLALYGLLPGGTSCPGGAG